MMPEVPYEVTEMVEMQPGDLLLAFTDGLIEVHDPNDAGGQLFGEQRVRELMVEHAADCTVRRSSGAAREFSPERLE